MDRWALLYAALEEDVEDGGQVSFLRVCKRCGLIFSSPYSTNGGQVCEKCWRSRRPRDVVVGV